MFNLLENDNSFSGSCGQSMIQISIVYRFVGVQIN